MNQPTKTWLGVMALLLAMAPMAHSHFTWMSSDSEGRALLFFAESPQTPDYKLPEAVTKAEVTLQVADATPQKLTLQTVENEEFIGRQSDTGVVGNGVLTSVCTYGNYHGTLLTYYVKHYAGDLAAATAAEAAKPADGFVFDLRPELIKKGIVLTATRDGEPLEGVAVTLIDPSGDQAEKETGKDGTVKFYHVASGPLGFIANVTEEKEGEENGEKYTSLSHYLTLTFDYAEGTQATAASTDSEKPTPSMDTEDPADTTVESALPPLPEGVTSFGAATCDGYVYVYSGHIGGTHEHTKENYSTHFRRMPLAGGEWEELPFEVPLQGFAVVPFEGKLIRVGGVFSRNAKDEDADMYSTDVVSMFDPETKSWAKLPALPEPRSSHDAVVIDGSLYVVGGWNLQGGTDGEWHDTAWKLDLANLEEGWKPLAKPTFIRRAMAASYLPGKLVVIGGIDDGNDISRDVFALDLATGEWTSLAELPGDGMQGFGVSAWNHEGKLYASGSTGLLYQLSNDGSEWIEVHEFADPRFFHRLLPAGPGRLLMLGGVSMDRRKHVGDSEWVELKPAE
ncbi:Kelch repeat-containing protein [Aeoliella mucimassa]|nr:kelch repeat-containing protein [Aeoliella mucimassa]